MGLALSFGAVSVHSYLPSNIIMGNCATANSAVTYFHWKEFRLNPTLSHVLRSLQRNILAGIVTIAPLFVTYLIFSFLLGILAKAGLPLLWILAYVFPNSRITEPWVQFVLAALERLPLVAKIYGSVRQLLDNMTAKKESSQRVVLVDFPIPGQKSIGFLS